MQFAPTLYGVVHRLSGERGDSVVAEKVSACHAIKHSKRSDVCLPLSKDDEAFFLAAAPLSGLTMNV